MISNKHKLDAFMIWRYGRGRIIVLVILRRVSVRVQKEKYEVRPKYLISYLTEAELDKVVEVHFLTHLLKSTSQKIYFYAIEHTGFNAGRHNYQGFYSKYSGIGVKKIGALFFTKILKFGNLDVVMDFITLKPDYFPEVCKKLRLSPLVGSGENENWDFEYNIAKA